MARCSLLTEGGPWGWVIILAACCCNFLITSITRCTGVLFSSFQREFMSTTSQTGAISSIISATSYLGCFFGGVLCNRFGCRPTTMFGGLLNTVGLIGGALTKNIYQMYVMGTLAGLGTGIASTPAVVIIAQYFQKNQAIMSGFGYFGIGVGLLAFAPFFQLLLDAYGWRGTLLITSGITSNICVAGAVFRPFSQSTSKSSRAELGLNESDERIDEDRIESEYTFVNSKAVTVKKSPSSVCFLTRVVKLFRLKLLRQSYRFSVFCFAQINYVMGYSCYLIYLIPCAVKSGVQDQRASFLISAVGITSLLGYLVSGCVNRKVSSEVIYRVAMVIMGSAVLMSLLAAHIRSYAVFMVSSAVMGGAVAFQHTMTPVILRQFVGKENMASAYGIYCSIAAGADLLGPIFAGALYDAFQTFMVPFLIFASFFFVGFLAMLLTPFLQRIEPGVSKETDLPI